MTRTGWDLLYGTVRGTVYKLPYSFRTRLCVTSTILTGMTLLYTRDRMELADCLTYTPQNFHDFLYHLKINHQNGSILESNLKHFSISEEKIFRPRMARQGKNNLYQTLSSSTQHLANTPKAHFRPNISSLYIAQKFLKIAAL